MPDLYQQSIEQVPAVIKLLKNKGYKFFTAAACNNDLNPHTSNDESVNSSSADIKNQNVAAPNEFVNNAAANTTSSATSSSTSARASGTSPASGSSVTSASNASYIMSLAILVLSVTILF